MNIQQTISQLTEGKILSKDESYDLFNNIFSGNVSDIDLTAILVALKMRKEHPHELTGAAISMRDFANKLNIPNDVFDTCGTGGDNSHSFNISSAVAIILNAMGYKIAKHGNRSISSKSGSADFYESLKIPINLTGNEAESYFNRTGFIFLFAPNYHPAMKFAMPVRKNLGIRTIFNFLGPLTNPVKPKKQMIGVFHPDFLDIYSQTALNLGYERILLYSSEKGMDEISPTDKTIIYDIKGNSIYQIIIEPEDYLNNEEISKLPYNKDANENANIFLETITNKNITPLTKLLALNTAVALFALEDNTSIENNFDIACDVITSGQVYDKFKQLVVE